MAGRPLVLVLGLAGGLLAALGVPVWAVVAALAALAAVGALVWLNWDAIVATGNTVLDWFQQKMLPFFTGLPEQLGGVFQDVAATVAGAVNEVITTVEAMANSVIGAINAIIEAWNSFELKMGGQTFLAGTPFEKKIPSVTIGTPEQPIDPDNLNTASRHPRRRRCDRRGGYRHSRFRRRRHCPAPDLRAAG